MDKKNVQNQEAKKVLTEKKISYDSIFLASHNKSYILFIVDIFFCKKT
jgi:hypothetical protein